MPSAAIDGTLQAVQRAGLRGDESGVLWLGHRAETAEVSTLVVPIGPGVTERPQAWDLSPEVLGCITSWASPKGLVMLGMAHTHGGGSVLMSWSDRFRTVQVPGMLSVIIGHGGRDQDPADWGWYVYEAGAYRDFHPSERMRRISIKPGLAVAVWTASSEHVALLFSR
jgi:hypothetical protein